LFARGGRFGIAINFKERRNMKPALGILTGILILQCNLAHAVEEIVVPEGGEFVVPTGSFKYDNLEIRKNGTLKFSGTTNLMVTKLVAAEGARILYERSDRSSEVLLNITVTRDASGLADLRIVGNGKNGTPDFQPGFRANGGSGGRNAKGPSFRYPNGKSASSGGDGGRGDPGGDGEEAADVTLYLPNVSAGSKLRADVIGGNGGRGQDGGNGGRGGDGSVNHDCRGGGRGGAGGTGGSAGDAGKFFVFLVVKDTDSAAAKKLKSGFKVEVNSARGVVGAGGQGGDGGRAGSRGGNPSQCPSQKGGDGSGGAAGAEGDGPRVANDETWVKTELMSREDYLIYLATLSREIFGET
jgi:hypothetical protein